MNGGPEGIQLTDVNITLPKINVAIDEQFDGDVMNWIGSGTGGDWLIEKATTKSLFGEKSLRIRTKTTTPATNDFVTAERVVGTPADGSLFDYSVGFVTRATKSTIQVNFGCSFWSAYGYATVFELRWNGATWQVRTGSAVYTDVTLPEPYTESTADYWNILSFQANTKTKQILTARVNDRQYPILLDSFTDSPFTGHGMYIYVRLQTLADAQKEMWIDALRVRVN